MKNREAKDGRVFIKVKQYNNAIVAIWREGDELGCEVFGNTCKVENRHITDLCFDELTSIPGFDRYKPLCDFEVNVSMRYKRRMQYRSSNRVE